MYRLVCALQKDAAIGGICKNAWLALGVEEEGTAPPTCSACPTLPFPRSLTGRRPFWTWRWCTRGAWYVLYSAKHPRYGARCDAMRCTTAIR
ncbi:hypothetical protein B0I35DRAFT_418836 [Stachybotrys elegans]|uniref:Uncharacterized protein n=1 Tax=Stachybotrys elegans TaxID=80388 RepID=A0A8K0WWR5_9HYPO|nr:hypothetical protein B0I35DRAFT_418836 [Stachybotrys elegans]